MSPILEAINNALYRPQDSALGITAGVLGQSAPALYNPYASTGSNLGYVGGSALLAGLLGGLAKYQANQDNISQLADTQKLLNATPEERNTLLARNSRLGPIMAALQAREEDQRANLLQKMQERSAMMPFNLQEETAKGLIGLLGEQGAQLSPQKLQQLANQDLDYSTLGVQTPAQLRLAEKRAEIPIKQEDTLAQMRVTNPAKYNATMRQLGALASAPEEDLEIPTDIYAGLLEEPTAPAPAGLPVKLEAGAIQPKSYSEILASVDGREALADKLYEQQFEEGRGKPLSKMMGEEGLKELQKGYEFTNTIIDLADQLDAVNPSWAEFQLSGMFTAADKDGLGLLFKDASDQLARWRSGAALNDTEVKLYNRLIKGDITGTPQQVAILLRKLADNYMSKMEYGVDLRQKANQPGATIADIFSETRAKLAAGNSRLIRGPDGREWEVIRD